MDISRVVEVFIRSGTSHDHVESGSGSPPSDVHDDHFGHANPGTVLFLFVAIGVGGKWICMHWY